MEDIELAELRLLLEDLCCDLCRFHHASHDRLSPEDVLIDRSYYLEGSDAFADIRVAPPGQPPYFIEVKYGYRLDRLLAELGHKYRQGSTHGATRVVVVIRSRDYPDWSLVQEDLARCFHASLQCEVWDEDKMLSMLKERFGVHVEAISAENLLDVREAVDKAKGYHAFGGKSLAQYTNDPVRFQLLWHFGFWRLRQLRDHRALMPREILAPRMYRSVVVLFGDLCGFSSYVRDTQDSAVVRHCLTSFYSKSRYQIINRGGMLYQFLGDGVLALFGIPDRPPGYIDKALDSAKALLNIGAAVTDDWSRRIDRIQPVGGLHVGMSIGEVQMLSLRPLSRTLIGAISDSINLAARLSAAAGPGEIVVSNALHAELDERAKSEFLELEPIEAKNVGKIRAWKIGPQRRPNRGMAKN